ncbi:MAG: hypothetical protein H6Q69_303 [Firmicutes bacterium]|nr:hypothetical protein [Bacillota bacterium]
MDGFTQCSGCRPPSSYYCDYKCPIAQQAQEDEINEGDDEA